MSTSPPCMPLECGSETKGPQPLHPASLLRDGIVQTGNRKAEQVHSYRCPEGLQRSADPRGVVTWLPIPPEYRLLIPGEPHVIENGSFDRGEALRQEPEVRRQNGEANLGTHHPDLGAHQAVELGAASLGVDVVRVETFVAAIGSRGVAPDQVGAPAKN